MANWVVSRKICHRISILATRLITQQSERVELQREDVEFPLLGKAAKIFSPNLRNFDLWIFIRTCGLLSVSPNPRILSDENYAKKVFRRQIR